LFQEGNFWSSPGWGDGHWKYQAMIRSLEFSPHPSMGRGERLEIELMIDHAHDEASQQSQKYRVWRASRLANTSMY